MVARLIFVNLPVQDLPRSMEFFRKLGWDFNPQFTDNNGACLVISDTIFAMLLTKPFFNTFTKKTIADTTTTNEAIIAISAESKDEVDKIVDTALAAGAKPMRDTDDLGWMYNRSFEDLDGHLWEIVWMDAGAVADGSAGVQN